MYIKKLLSNGEINVSKEELDYIAKSISILYINSRKLLEVKLPVSVSVFLVWCTVYEYKEGDMWSYIFKKLELEQSPYGVRFLGDIFLDTINKYGLIGIKKGEGKKYLSPILMHGYISNNYAPDLFAYLNKIYSLVLEEGTREDLIEDVWDDVFIEDTELSNIRKHIVSLQDEKETVLV